MRKIDPSLFSGGDPQSFGSCPKCQSSLSLKYSKKGAFIGCSDYPSCDFTQTLHDNEVEIVKVMEETECPECGSHLVIKKGRYGLFVGCSTFPTCHYVKSLKQNEDTQHQCPQCSKGHLVKRVSRFGKTFYACDNYPKCKYALNHPPVKVSCECCGFPLMVRKQNAAGTYLQCPEKKCQHKQN